MGTYHSPRQNERIKNTLIRDDILVKLARYETSLSNRIARTIQLLERLQASRLEAGERLRFIESAIGPEKNSDESAAVAAIEPDRDD